MGKPNAWYDAFRDALRTRIGLAAAAGREAKNATRGRPAHRLYWKGWEDALDVVAANAARDAAAIAEGAVADALEDAILSALDARFEARELRERLTEELADA